MRSRSQRSSAQVELFTPGRPLIESTVRARGVVGGASVRLCDRTRRARVLAALREAPRTDEEICRVTGLRGSSVRPRRLELVHEGAVEDSGTVRATECGRPAIVWRLTQRMEGVRCGSR